MTLPALQQHNYNQYFQGTSFADVAIDSWDAVQSAAEGIGTKASYSTSDGGTVNDIFTAVLYAQYNRENNFLAVAPQVDRSQNANLDSGTANAKAFRAAHSPVPLQTHPEGGQIPDAEKFEVEEVVYDIKRSETVISTNDIQQIESMISDSVGFDEFWELQEEQLDLAVDQDALAAPALESDSAYDAVTTPTPYDRVISSSEEEANSTDTDGVAFTDGALDVGTVDRSTDTWADSYVDYGSGGGTLRQLNTDVMDSFIDGLVNHGSAKEENLVLVTGRDSGRVLSEIQKGSSTEIIYDSTDGGREMVNDAETVPGLGGTRRLRSYDDIPIVTNQTAPSDSLSRIFAFDMSTIRGEPKFAIEQYAEPYFEQAGRNQQQGYISQGEYTEKALFLLNHETVVRDFGAHGKLTHLEE